MQCPFSERDLKPTLHVVRLSAPPPLTSPPRRSKYGEPTYLFAGIVDTDPQAFVAVTLNKRKWVQVLMLLVLLLLLSSASWACISALDPQAFVAVTLHMRVFKIPFGGGGSALLI